MRDDLPTSGGSYLVCLYLAAPVTIQVGRLGGYLFPKGHYYYSGSAFGPGGLAARLGRHLRIAKVHHWHVDELRSRAEVGGYLFAEAVHQECTWAKILAGFQGASLPVKGFGASDCHAGCLAHLVRFEDPIEPVFLVEQLSLAGEGIKIRMQDARKID